MALREEDDSYQEVLLSHEDCFQQQDPQHKFVPFPENKPRLGGIFFPVKFKFLTFDFFEKCRLQHGDPGFVEHLDISIEPDFDGLDDVEADEDENGGEVVVEGEVEGEEEEEEGGDDNDGDQGENSAE